MRLTLCVIALILLSACHSPNQARVHVVKNKSHVAYVEELQLLAPQVCMKSNLPNEEPIPPFLIDITVEGKLAALLDLSSNQTIDSRNVLQRTETSKELFCTGNNMKLNQEVREKDLKKWIKEENITVTLTELNGDIIERSPLTAFKIGEMDGAVSKP
ncbi:hypothetical protein [Halobacillus salinus]|uniref:Uncharacterized protein n=1 Tax=Halobacillus salinus TaxID=192814 RepID=A0A4Z0GYJ3_9BACI|nr:hypothetical protein [Halobacillus salinus]TGB02919.1 hypothetical protein E4663_12275 [Halobacillus salinus]